MRPTIIPFVPAGDRAPGISRTKVRLDSCPDQNTPRPEAIPSGNASGELLD
jgi:hypothetical protein